MSPRGASNQSSHINFLTNRQQNTAWHAIRNISPHAQFAPWLANRLHTNLNLISSRTPYQPYLSTTKRSIDRFLQTFTHRLRSRHALGRIKPAQQFVAALACPRTRQFGMVRRKLHQETGPPRLGPGWWGWRWLWRNRKKSIPKAPKISKPRPSFHWLKGALHAERYEWGVHY